MKLDEARKLPPEHWRGETVTEGEVFGPPKPHKHFVSIEPLLGEVFISPLANIDWIIIGAETGSRKGKVIPEKEWIDDITHAADRRNAPVFMKDSLIPVVGEENMRRETPREVKKNEVRKNRGQSAAAARDTGRRRNVLFRALLCNGGACVLRQVRVRRSVNGLEVLNLRKHTTA